MIGLIFAFIGRNWMVQLAAALLVAWVSLKGWGMVKYHLGWTQGQHELAEDLNRQGDKIESEVAKAQEPAEQPGSAARLLKEWCRDCK